MSERGTETPTGATRTLTKGNKMSTITVTSEAIDALTKSSLRTLNSVGQASVDFYLAALEEVGIDPESLSFSEVVEVTRRLYAPSADYRRTQADVAKAEKDAERAAAKAKRDAEREERAREEIKKIEAKLAKLRGE